MAKDKFEYSQLFAGEVDHIVRVPVANATINRGDVLVGAVTGGVVADSFAKATEDAKVGNIYVVAADNVKDYTGDVVAYAGGCFDSAQIKINDAEITDASKLALMASNIYVLTTN